MDINIFEYMNYREFLQAYYDHAKKTNKNFSHRYFIRKAGIAATNFLYLVMSGKRNLTKEHVPKFSNAIGLNKKEYQYFDALVAFNQVKDAEARRYYLELLNDLRKDKCGVTLSEEQYEFFSNWYYPVVRELINLPSFKEDRDWIRRRVLCKVTGRQVNEALSTLIRLGLVKRDKNRRLVQTDKNIISEDEVAFVAAYKFHQQMLNRAKEVLSLVGQEKREISGITMAVSEKQFKEIKKKVQEFEDDIIRYLNNNPDMPDSVYQMNVQLFPLALTGEKK